MDLRTVFAGPNYPRLVDVKVSACEMSDTFVCIVMGLPLVLHYVVAGKMKAIITPCIAPCIGDLGGSDRGRAPTVDK